MAEAKWMPIETASKDGFDILGFWTFLDGATGVDIIRWERHRMSQQDVEGWRDSDGLVADGVYTHWMPLPSPPEEDSRG